MHIRWPGTDGLTPTCLSPLDASVPGMGSGDVKTLLPFPRCSALPLFSAFFSERLNRWRFVAIRRV
jgi:hypothetical protein